MLVLTEPTTTARASLCDPREDRAEGVQLDGVAERRAGAVRLDVADVARRRAALAPTPPHERACCASPFGAVSPLLSPVLIDGRAADQRQHAVAVALGVRESLEHDHAAALAADVAVGARRRKSCSGRRATSMFACEKTM